LYEIIDNLLTEEEYGYIEAALTDDKGFPWFYGDGQNVEKDDSPYFYHVLYVNNRPNSQWFDFVQPILDKIKCQSLIQCRANCVVKMTNGVNKPHVDNYSDSMSHKTAVFYIGDCNGATVLLDGEEEIVVDHKPNRIVVFDAKTRHYARHQTDTNRRIVINFNYF
jgi:hypothetical protein